MTKERWRQVEALFHAALEREPNERSAFLDRECAGDESVRLEVESLSASHNESEYGLDAADLAADLLGKGESQSLVGRSFGPYRVLKPLARGGMGAVFVAQDHRLGRQVALKLLPSGFAADRDRLRRFEQEARAASALNHPNIVTVYDAGDANGIPFIAMELVDGTTLGHRLARGRLKLSEALEIAAQIASALGAAHRAGIIHRDIKPENVLLRTPGGAPGDWAPTPPAFFPAFLPGWGEVTPFALNSAAQFLPDPPGFFDLASEEFARDYNEVKDIGHLNSTSRTAEQSEIARFWYGKLADRLESNCQSRFDQCRARRLGEWTPFCAGQPRHGRRLYRRVQDQIPVQFLAACDRYTSRRRHAGDSC